MRVAVFGLLFTLSGCIVPGGVIHPISEWQIVTIFAPERGKMTVDELHISPATKSGKVAEETCCQCQGETHAGRTGSPE